MLESLITSKTRVKLLLKFFINPETRGYLRSLADEFGESTNSIRIELNRLADADLLMIEKEGNKRVYKANIKSSLFPEIHSLVKKNFGIDIIENVVSNLGNVEIALVTGDYAKGTDSGIIDLVLVGDINKTYLDEIIIATEEIIKRRIRVLVLCREEFEEYRESLEIDKALVVWSNKQK